MKGGALLVSLGCEGEGGTGPTLVLYLRGAGAVGTEAWGTVAASAGPMAGLPWAAVRAAATVVGGGVAAAAGPGLDLPAGGGEELRTLGLKMCSPRVFTMVGLRKEWRGWEDERMG